MKLYTSYFARLRQLRAAGIVPISIARYTPRWAGKIARIESLAPSENTLLRYKGDHDEAAYTERYMLGFANRAASDLVQQIERISGGADVALCCYEKPGDFCHRHLVAAWLRGNGVKCEEWRKQDAEDAH